MPHPTRAHDETDAERRAYKPALAHHWLTRVYDPVVRFTSRESACKARLLEQASLDHAAALLDVGCGTGTFSIMAKRANPALRVVGVDADPAVLEIAHRKADEAGVTIELVRGSATSLPAPDKSFDRVVSSLFFHHLDRAAKVTVGREIARVLSTGGELHVADWGAASNPVMRAAFLVVQALDGFETTRDNVQGRLPELFATAGLDDVEQVDEMSTMLGTIGFYRARREPSSRSA